MAQTKPKLEQKTKNLSIERNEGTVLDLNWINSIRVNKSAVERRASSLTKRRSVKKDWQIAWLLKAVTCIDLTTLSGDDTEGKIKRLCTKAKVPIRKEILEKLSINSKSFHTGAVCVYPEFISEASEEVKGAGIPVAAVSTGFPAGHIPFDLKLKDIEYCVANGADEIDIVINRKLVLQGKWKELYEEVSAFRIACGDAHMKTILATGELGTLRNVAKASVVCMMAGADFIKTSTGKETENATLPVSLVMVRMIREFYKKTGYKVGFKPAGGIKTAKQSIQWLILIKEELGDEWLTPKLFRFGASSLLADIERQLEYHVEGFYSAANRNPVS